MRQIALFLFLVTLVKGTAGDRAPLADRCGSVDATATMSAADETYRLAKNAWAAARYPKSASFIVTIHLHQAERDVSVHYRGEEDFRTGDIYVDRFSDEEQAHPKRGASRTAPYSIHASYGRRAPGAVPLRNDEVQRPWAQPSVVAPRELLGTPHLSIDYSFGLRAPAAVESSSENLSALKAIGKVSINSPTYRIQCAVTTATEPIHLSLMPTRDPAHYRLRELWIDPVTFATDKVQTAGNFTKGPPTRCDWLTTFSHHDGATYIAQETALAPLDYGRGDRYEDVSIRFEAIVPSERPSVRMLLAQAPNSQDLLEP